MITLRRIPWHHVSVLRDGVYVGRVWWRGDRWECSVGFDLWSVTDRPRKGESVDALRDRLEARAIDEVVRRVG